MKPFSVDCLSRLQATADVAIWKSHCETRNWAYRRNRSHKPPEEDYVAALIYPDFGNLRRWAADHDVAPENPLSDPAVLDLYASEIKRINLLIEIKYQRVKRAVLADRGPSLDNGELTPSGKLVRKVVLDSFKDKIDALFAPQPSAEVIEVPEESQRTVSSEA